MLNLPKSLVSFLEFVGSKQSCLSRATILASLFGLIACSSEPPITPIIYECGSDPNLAFENHKEYGACGAGDPKLMRTDATGTKTSIEPTWPDTVCMTLPAKNTFPDEHNLDTEVQDALTFCRNKGAVKLVVGDDPSKNSFVTGHLNVYDVVLWVDAGVTLYASRDPAAYQNTGNCGVLGINDSSACLDYITVNSTPPANPGQPPMLAPAIIGDGVIDGQGGEPLVGHDYSWWQMSGALRDVDGSIGNPTLINLGSNTTRFWMYHITLHNSPKFHVKVSSAPSRPAQDAPCTNPGDGFVIWGVTILTPSNWFNSQGILMNPQYSRNSDGIDPGANDDSSCGVIACSTISTGDDHIAIKGGHSVTNLIIAHNHFGTGHGMSIGSETYGDATSNGVKIPSVSHVEVYDLTIDADSRWVGNRASGADFNGIRIKTDTSRGGHITDINYHDICMRDITNSILISTAYNPLFAGTYLPDFGEINFKSIHGVTCMAQTQTVVSINGFNVNQPTGPVTLDNVIMDNIGPEGTFASFSNIVLGPGNVNFTPSGLGVSVDNRIVHGGTDDAGVPNDTPKECVFPTLPQPKGKPQDWVW